MQLMNDESTHKSSDPHLEKSKLNLLNQSNQSIDDWTTNEPKNPSIH